jgi:hypothetical protein
LSHERITFSVTAYGSRRRASRPGPTLVQTSHFFQDYAPQSRGRLWTFRPVAQRCPQARFYTATRTLAGGQTALSEAIANVTSHAGSRSLAIFFTSTVAIGIAAGAHTLPIAGPFITGAAITGGLAGKDIAGKLCSIRVPGRIADWLVNSMQRVASTSATLAAQRTTVSA